MADKELTAEYLFGIIGEKETIIKRLSEAMTELQRENADLRRQVGDLNKQLKAVEEPNGTHQER